MELPNDDTQERLEVEALVRKLGYQPGDLTRMWKYGPPVVCTNQEIEALVREVSLLHWPERVKTLADIIRETHRKWVNTMEDM